ncbi:hypothetical protein PanWU01x14_288460 [Parasponia andersonii]|uniref:Titin-like n=1 Tax=Parasponia andersonii TaxID=3476 RepID=A0A2P5AYD2_PARAD|nr:hypothetical protein PanWU01x14_288460 [Parasponia andersonii]
MATEAGIPEVISHTKGEVEDTYSTTGQSEKTANEVFPVELKKGKSQLNEHPETGEFISENKQVAGSTEVEIVNNVVDGNFGNLEDGSTLAAPSGPTVQNEEASKPEHCLVDELNPLETEISENAKHLEKGQEFGVVEETAREGEVVEEKNQKADQYDKNHDIQNATETSSHVTKSEGVKFEVEGEEIVKNKINLDQNVNVILNQKDSSDEGPRSMEKETKDLKEKDSHTDVFSDEVSSILERTLEHDNEVSVHTPDLTVNKDVQSVSETFPRDEKTNNNLSREATPLQEEYTEERGFKEKEQDKCIDLSTEGKVSEAIYPSENIGTEDEKDLITHDHIGDASISTIASSQESQNNETGDSVKDKLEMVSVVDEVDIDDAEFTEEEKHKEVSGTTCKQKNQDTNELSKHEKDEAPIENEVQNKSSSVTLNEAKAEDTSSQELDNPDILKVNTEIRLDDIAKESQIEVTKQSEVLEETVQVNDTASGDVNSDDNSEQELDSSSRKHEDSHGGGVGLVITEAAVEEAQDTEASNLAATEDTSTVKLIQAEELTEADSRKHKEHPDDTNEAAVEEAQDAEGSSLVAAEDISTVKLVQAEELTESDSTKHDEPPGNSLLWQNEPEEKKLQTHLNVISEVINSVEFSEDAATIACIKEGETKNLEEIFEKTEKGEEPIATSDTRGKEIPSEEIITNLPPTHSDDKTESSVEEFPKNDADNSHVMHFLVEQAEVQGEKIDEAKVDSHEKGYKSNEASRKGEKPDDDESGADQGTEEENLQHTSTEGTVPTEIELETSESTEKPEKDYGSNSKESLEPEDSPQDISEEVKNEAEVTEIDTEKFVKKSRETEEGLTLDDVQAHNTVTATTDDPILQVESPEEEAFKSRGEDESRKLESNEEISNEERTVEDVNFSIPEQIQVDISKGNQDNVKDAEKLNDEESTTEIIKEGCYLNALSPENIQEDAIKTLKDQENEAERPKGEIVEEIETAGASESILSETNKDVEIFADASYLDPTEALVAKNNVEDSFSIEVVKENDDNTAKESERQLELASESEEDQQQTVQKDVPGEKHENLLHLAPEETEIEPLSENARGVTPMEVEGTTQNIEDTSETEKKGEKAENTDSRNDFEKEISEELETAGAGESIPRETKEDVENLVVGSLVKQEEQKGVEVEEEDYENNVKATETSIDVASKDEANQQISPEETETEPRDKLENVLRATPEEPKTKPATEDAANIICIEGEGMIQDLKETSETEKEGEKAKNTDNAIDSEKEEKGIPSIETKRQTLDQQGIAEQSPPSLGEEIVEENSKEAEKISKELETNGACVSIPRETSFVVASLVKQEEHKEVDNKGCPNALSPENIQEDAIKTLKDQENEAERPKGEETTVLERGPPCIETERENLDEQGIAELSSSSLGEEKVEENSKETEKISKESETNEAGESFPCETQKEIESFVVDSLVKQEEEKEVDKEIVPVEALKKENTVEDKFATEVPEEDYEVKATETSTEIASKGEANQHILHEETKTEPADKLENVLQATPEETETIPASEDATNVTCIEGEGQIQNLKETSASENKNIDNAIDLAKEVLESTNAGQESKEQVLRELDGVEDLQPEYIDTETAGDTEQSRVITGLETGAPSIEVERQNSEEQGIAEPSSLSLGEEIVEEDSKDIVKEEDTHFEPEEHNEVTNLVEEVKPESLEDNAKPDKDLDTAKTTEIPVEEKVGGEEPQEKEPIVYSSDSVSTEIHSEESLKEAEPDNKEKVKSYDITVEKDLRNSADTEVQSDSIVPEFLSDETGLNEAESDNKEQDRSYNNVPKWEGLENSVEIGVQSDSVSIATVSEETSLKESEQESEEQVKSHDIAPSTIIVNEEKVEENSKETEKISKESETNGAGESIPRETKGEIESFVVASLVKQEQEKEVDKKLVQVEALREQNTVEDAFATEVVEEDSENNIKATETSLDVASKGEAYQHILPEETETEPVDNLENVLQVTPEETKTKPASEDATSITCIEGKGEIQNLKETSESENKNIDNSIDLEKEVLETTDAEQETREQVLKELDSVKDLHPENTDTETAEDTKESQVSTGMGTMGTIPPSIEVERQNLEEQGNAEPSSSLLGEEIIEERSTDIIKEEDTCFELKEQNEETNLVEEIKPEILEESAKPDNNFDTTKTIETPVEETQEKEPTVYPFDSVSTKIHNEETSLKEAEPDKKEKVNSNAITLEEKGLDIEVKSDTHSPEILSEETGLNEAGPDNKEQDRSYIDVPKEEEPENSVEIGVQSDSVSARTVSAEISLKEVDQDNKEQLKSYDFARSNIVVSEETSSKEAKLDNDEHVKISEIAPEDKRPGSDVDVEVESKSVSAEILSEETWIKEAKQEHEEQVSGSNSNTALEEKGTTSNVDTNVQGDSVSTKTVNEETSLKEAELDNEKNVKRFDIAPEEKGLVAAVDIEVQSVPVSAGMESEETCLAEAKEAHEERVNGSNIALEEKDLARNVDIDVHYDSVSTQITSEETSLKEVEPDNEEQVKVHGIAPEEKGLVINTDTEVQPESVSVGTDEKENFLKEAKRDEEEVDSSKTALEEKDLERSVNIDVQHVFVSTEVKSEVVSAGTESEETCLEEAKAKNDEQVKSFDRAHEDEGLEIEEMDLKEAKQNDKEQVKNSDVSPEENGLASNVGGDVPQKENSDSEESKEQKIPTITGESEEKIEQKVEDETPTTRTENKEKETTVEKTLDDAPEDNLQESSTVPFEENELKVIESNELSDETTASDKTESGNAKLPVLEPTKEEGLLQREDDYKLESYVIEKEVANEENQKQLDLELNITREITSNENSSASGDVGISEREEASEISYFEPLKDEEQSVKFSNSVAVCADMENEKAILKQNKTDTYSEGSLRGMEGEQAALELEASETKNGEHPRNQNLEPDDLGQKLASTSDVIPKDQTEETPPLTKKSETEEEDTNIREQNLKSIEQQILGANSEGAKEIEPELTVVDHVSETQCLNEISQGVISTEVHEEVDKADESENTKEQVIDRESNLRGIHPESIQDERADKEKASGSIVTEFLKTTDSSENTFGVSSQAEEHTTKKDEAVKIAADEGKINEGMLNPVDVFIALPEEGKSEQEIKGEVDDHWDKNDTSTAREATRVSNLEESQLVDEPVEAFDNGLEERNLDLLKAECAIPADKGELKLEETSFNLVPMDQKDTATENIAEENLNVNEVEENKLFSSVEGIDPTKASPDVEKLEEKIKEDEIRNDQAPEDGISEKQLQAPSSTLVPRYQEPETETRVKIIKDVDSLSTEKEASSPIYLQKEEPSDRKLREVAEERLGTNETEEDINTVHETVFESSQESTSAVRKAVDITNQALSTGISTEQVQVSSSAVHPEEPQPEATDLVRKTEEENTRGLEILDNKEDDSLATEQGEETYLKKEFGDLKVGKKVVERLVADDIEEEIIEAPSTVSTEDRIITNQDLPAVTWKDQFQVSLHDEQEKSTSTTLKKVDEENKNVAKILYDEDSRDSSATKTDKEKCLQEEPREYKASDSFGEVLGSDETKETINASQNVSETNSQSIEVVPDEKIITCEPIPDKTAEVQLVGQYGILLPGEQDDGITSTTKAIEEENTKEVEVLTKTVEETRELEVSGSTVDVLGADKIEDITEVSVTKEKENSPGIEVASKDRSLDQALPVDKDEIITDKVLPAGVSAEQLQIPSFPTSIPNEQEQDAAVTVKKIEEEETKEAKLPNEENFKDSNAEKTIEEIRLYKEENIQGGSNEVTKKEGGTINEVPKIEAQETVEDAENAFSPSENDETAESRRAVVEASTPDVANQKIASEFVSEKDQSHESITSIENVEIIENHLKVATTDLPTQEYQPETTIEAEQTTAKEISEQEEVRSIEIPHWNRSLHIEEAQSSHEKYQEQTPTEADSVESTAAKITTSNRGASILQDSVEETSQSAESKDIRPRNETWAEREIKEEELGAEKEADHSGIRKTGTEPAMPSLSDLMQSSTEEKTQVAEHTTKEEEPKSSKEAEHSPTHEGKADEEEHEEEEHEHEHEDEDEDEDHPDTPILVQASKDIDAKATRKKSHGIFSGVGSKVKHSISKVKKAITGKSSHSKTQPSS